VATHQVAQSVPVSPPELEARALGAGMVVVGNPSTGYRLHRRPGEKVIPLSGNTLNKAYGHAAMGMLYERDWDALFGKRRLEPAKEPSPGFVYFIGGDVGAVKIGFAVNPDLRIRDLQCGSPIPLRILARVAGMPQDERDYHKRFKAHRLHREWFERCPEIEAEIARLAPKDAP
jgi:hypothetical protein